MGLEFQVKNSKVCYTPLKDKCAAIRNLELPKTLKQTRAFCGMVMVVIIASQFKMTSDTYLCLTKEVQKV